MVNTRAMTGFMELTPGQQLEFDRIRRVIEQEYVRFGFTPIDTPGIERSEVLLAKAGGETEKQIYRFTKGGDDVSLRFDLTVPLARYVAEHYSELVFPFRRSHIAKVYRGERPQKGRYREFYQCDIDVIGECTLGIAYDAEIPRVIYSTFSRLDFGKFTIKVNNRMILSGLMSHLNAESISTDVLRVVDKIEKISHEEFISELKALGLSESQVNDVVRFIRIKDDPDSTIDQLRAMGVEDDKFEQGVNDLETVVRLMRTMGIPDSHFAIDLSIARGLDYYTGTIYETTLDNHSRIGSICSGGRYDNLASCYTDRRLPGVGISIGLTRLFSQLLELDIVGSNKKTVADVLVIPLTDSEVQSALTLANQLRSSGNNVDVLLTSAQVKRKFRYADRIGVPNVIVVGADEVASQLFTLQNMSTGNKLSLTVNEISERLTS
ncbi:MAG: histidine--tRNA ligase [Candidatus Woesebacteria bacterium]